MLELAEPVIQFFGLIIRGVFLVLGAIFELAANLLPDLPNIDVPDGISSTVEGAAGIADNAPPDLPKIDILDGISSTAEGAADIADNLRRKRSGDDPPA